MLNHYTKLDAMKHDEITPWNVFAKRAELTEAMVEQFKMYFEMLRSCNELINLTTITKMENVISYHFEDSLELGKIVDMNDITCIADIGTGAGFPGLALKIRYPHLKVVLIEVNHKKIEFLEDVCHELKLEDVDVYPLDWRTFLRKSEYDIDLFCTRASLPMDELMRMFKPGCRYKNSQLVYWASSTWEPTGETEKGLLLSQHEYGVKNKRRKLISFGINQ